MLKFIIESLLSKLIMFLIATGPGKKIITRILLKTREVLCQKAGTTLGFVMMDNVLMSSSNEIVKGFLNDHKNAMK